MSEKIHDIINGVECYWVEEEWWRVVQAGVWLRHPQPEIVDELVALKKALDEAEEILRERA